MFDSCWGQDSSCMKQQCGIKKTNKTLVLVIVVSLFISLAVPAFAQQAGSSEKKKETRAEFEARKAEWEKVRDQQIELLREKEEQLEELKETLFHQMRTANSSSSAMPQKENLKADQPSSDETLLKEKIYDLKRVNRQLSDEITTYASENRKLKEKLEHISSSGTKTVTSKSEKQELEAQKAAFQKERQKFFQEMTRQKEKLQEMEDSLQAEKAALNAKVQAKNAAT